MKRQPLKVTSSVREYILRELKRDPAMYSNVEAEETYRNWMEGQILSPKEVKAIGRATEHTIAALQHGRLQE